MQIGNRRWSVVMLAVAGVLAVAIIGALKTGRALDAQEAFALVGMVLGYCGPDAYAKAQKYKLPADPEKAQA